MNKKKVLFIINGLGLGNSTRCSAIIHEMYLLKYQIDVVTSSNGLNYFRATNEVTNLFSFKPLLYGKVKGKLSILYTLLMVPKLLMIFIENCFLFRLILKKTNYSAVVFDSDYTAFFALWKRPRPLLIALNNAIVVVQECKKISKLPQSIRLQYWLEKMDCWYHNVVPDLVICPRFSNKIGSQYKKIKYTLPIVRSGLYGKSERETLNNILVMLSGSQFGSETYFLNKLNISSNIKINVIGKSGLSSQQIIFYDKIYNNQNLLNSADLLVINAGFSAISEALVLRVPAVIIPIENHAEQYINSILFEKLGLGLVATQENAHEKIIEVLSNYPKYLEAHKNFNISANGTKEALQIIEESLNSKQAKL